MSDRDREKGHYPFNARAVVKSLKFQKERLTKEEKKSFRRASSVVIIIATFLGTLVIDGIASGTGISYAASVVIIAFLFFEFILLVQVDSLRREIRSLLPEFEEDFRSSPLSPTIRYRHFSVLTKLYDVHKNALDKLFDKVKLLSTTWLVVSGGFASTSLVDLYKSSYFDWRSNLIILCCSGVLWSTAQDAYGVLNYELAKQVKDLALWWINIIS